MKKAIVLERIAHHSKLIRTCEMVQDKAIELAHKATDLPISIRLAEEQKLSDQYEEASVLIDRNERKRDKLLKKLKKMEK